MILKSKKWQIFMKARPRLLLRPHLLRLSSLMLLFIFSARSVTAAGDAPLISLANTDFVVLIAFIAFVSLLIYFRVPTIINSLLDKRSLTIKEEIEAATKVLEESKSLLAELEREHKNNIQKAEQVLKNAEDDSKQIIENSKKHLRLAIERKIKLAEDQIKATENAVVKGIRERAIDESIQIAESKLSDLATPKKSDAFIKRSIEQFKDLVN